MRPNVLVVDDELPALEELVFLLRGDERVDHVWAARSATEALQRLDTERIDAVFLDIRMPQLSGLDLARVLSRFAQPPAVVFVTAYDDHAVDAFDLDAVDYLLKPVRPERLAEAVRRVIDRHTQPSAGRAEETIPVELGGVTRFVSRSSVRYVEAHGDYARLHTGDGTHLVRTSLTTLEERWKDAGFVRIHRRLLVALAHVSQVRQESGRVWVRVGDEDLAVSRRHTRELRDVLVRRARPTAPPEPPAAGSGNAPGAHP